MVSSKEDPLKLNAADTLHASMYSTRYFAEAIPKFRIPEKSMPASAAYQLIHDELLLDGNPAQNLSSFVTPWMEPEADKLIIENINKNFIDHFQYPQTEVIKNRIVNMLAHLFNAPKAASFAGTATIGSSEAIMLGLLAHKWSWKKRRQAINKPDNKPNIIFGADAHVCWDKFAKYFDVEPRIIPMEPDRFTITTEAVAERIDENTICVGAILGTTFTGETDPVKDINDLLLNIKKEKGWDIPIHVDAAAGGFVLPFSKPRYLWDFRLPQVKSINTSGHKYGLVYAGLGWLVFRDRDDLPEELIFNVNYLGASQPTYTLNFSQGSSMILAQYYNLLRLGREGYTSIINTLLENARHLAKGLERIGRFEILNNATLVPMVTAKLKASVKFTVFDISYKLREYGWIVSAYNLPPNAQDTEILRIVVKENFSRDMADLLIGNTEEAIKHLEKGKASDPIPKYNPRKAQNII